MPNRSALSGGILCLPETTPENCTSLTQLSRGRLCQVGAAIDLGGAVGPRRLAPLTVEGLAPLLEGGIAARTPIINRPGAASGWQCVWALQK